MERFRLKYESSTQRPRSRQKAMTTMMRENGSAMMTVIQSRLKTVGISRTQTTNSRIVRPWEILAMNRPTNGAQEIHQTQYMMVQLVNHSSLVLL